MFGKIIFLALATSCFGVTFWKDCGSKNAVINDVTFTNCTTGPCIVRPGRLYISTSNVTSKVTSNTLPVATTGNYENGLYVYTANDEGCRFMDTNNCPVGPNGVYTFSSNFTAPALIPPGSLQMTVVTKDDSGEVFTCSQFNITLVSN